MKTDSASFLETQTNWKKTKKSLASSSAWPDWNSQSFKAIHTFAKSGRIKKGQSIKTPFG